MSAMLLCANRPEGFGPGSSLHPRLPTTCFLDVIVEPMATWIFLAAALVVAVLGHGRRWRSGHRTEGSWRWRRRRGTWQETPVRRSVLARVVSVLYYVLLVALLAMQSLEIARLVVAQLGIGLLPFTYVGVLLALATRLRGASRAARLLNAVFWVLLAAALALKTATEQVEQMSPQQRRTKEESGIQGMYPTSDEVLDNAVMLGVALVLALLEFTGWKSLERR